MVNSILSNKPTVLIIANCQSGPIMNLLKALSPGLIYSRTKQIHLLNENELDVFNSQVESSDIVIHQPISDNFKEFAIEKVKSRFPGKQFISFPSIYFRGYHPWLMYMRKPGGGTLQGPLGDYHDERIVQDYINHKTKDESLMHLVSECDLDKGGFYAREFDKIESREEMLDTKVGKYLQSNFQYRKLFFTFNHPANEVLIHVCIQLLQKLGMPPSQESILLASSYPNYLSTSIAPIDTAVNDAGCVASDDGCYKRRLDKMTSVWNRAEFIDACYKVYSNIENIEEIYNFAKSRQLKMGH